MQCEAEALSEILSRAFRFIPKLSPMMILKCFKFFEDTVQASSLHLGAKLKLPNGISFEKPIYVNAELTGSIVNKLNGTIKIAVTDKIMSFKDMTSSFKVPIVAVKDFPEFPECKANFVKAPLIHQAVKAVSPFTDDPESGKVHSGVKISDDKVIATDFKCIALANVGANTGLNEVIGPGLVAQFGHDVGTEIAIQGGQIFVKSPAGLVFGGMLEGKFPGYETLLAQCNKPELKFEINRDDLHVGLGKANIICRERDTRWAYWHLKDNKLTIEATTDAGQAVIIVPIKGNGEVKFRINVQMVERWFKSVKEPELTIECGSGVVENAPIKFEGKEIIDGQELVSSAYIMPMTITVPGATDGTKKG